MLRNIRLEEERSFLRIKSTGEKKEPPIPRPLAEPPIEFLVAVERIERERIVNHLKVPADLMVPARLDLHLDIRTVVKTFDDREPRQRRHVPFSLRSRRQRH